MATTLRNFLEGIKDPREIQRILTEHEWANPPSTNAYNFRVYRPETGVVCGSLVAEDGDTEFVESRSLAEVLDYFAIDTLERHPADRRDNPFVGVLPADW